MQLSKKGLVKRVLNLFTYERNRKKKILARVAPDQNPLPPIPPTPSPETVKDLRTRQG